MVNSKKHYRIVLIEPSAIVAAGLQELIKIHREFEVVAVLADCYHYTERIRSLQPDIIVINPSVVDYQHRPCVESVFTGMDHASFVALVYQYVKPDELKRYRAVVNLEDDREKVVKKLYQAMDAGASPADRTEGDELSEREKEILVSVAKGMINKEIAEEHHISIHTVISHRKNITRKTGIKSVSGLTVYALLNNLISMDEVE